MNNRIIQGKKETNGVPPAVILINPKYDRNVGNIVRACSCFGVKQIWFTGNRIKIEEGKRLPREERMKGYKDVTLIQFDYPFDQFKRHNVTPVALEIKENSENLVEFEHPENAVYVFGPEDGSIPSVYLQHCHRFTTIPTFHCTNLAAAVYITLYDRMAKSKQFPILNEDRGYAR